jgi:hypothetical protein
MDRIVLPNDVLLNEVAQLLGEGREVVITPKGRSMLPFIRGEVDQIKLRQPDGLRVGDIVLAYFENHYVLHRIVAINGEEVVLMGDGNLKGTEQGDRSEVVGKVVEIITPDLRQHKPGKAWLWRHTLFFRKYLLKVYRKWNKLMNRQF